MAPRYLSKRNAGIAKAVLHHALNGDYFYPTTVSIWREMFKYKYIYFEVYIFLGDATQVDNNSDDFKATE